MSETVDFTEEQVMISLICEASLRDAIRALADKAERSMSAEVRLALREHVAQNGGSK
jgi:hypothetical protein